MKPLTFLGQTFATEKDFERAYPAYGSYSKLVIAGCDTPLKIEAELHRKSQKLAKGKPRYGSVQKRRQTA